MDQPNLWICAGLVLFGILFHFITKLTELESQGRIVTPWGYWRQNPYTSLSVLMASFSAMLLMYSIGELTYYASAITGLACNSLGDKLRAKSTAWADKVTQGKP